MCFACIEIASEGCGGRVRLEAAGGRIRVEVVDWEWSACHKHLALFGPSAFWLDSDLQNALHPHLFFRFAAEVAGRHV